MWVTLPTVSDHVEEVAVVVVVVGGGGGDATGLGLDGAAVVVVVVVGAVGVVGLALCPELLGAVTVPEPWREVPGAVLWTTEPDPPWR